MKKLNLPHEICEYACMWNGIDDLYEFKTGIRPPKYLFFGISGFGNFVYLKNSKADVKRKVYMNNGLTKKMYDFMKDIINFDYKIIENNTFKYTLDTAKKEIDKGNPVVLGALDIYYLKYFTKFYKKIHIPIHYVLMIGYNDEKGIVHVLDTDRKDSQIIPYKDLEKAMNINVPGFSKKNTLFKINFANSISSIKDIVYKGLKKKAYFNLNPPVSFMGINGMRKFIREFPNWHKELEKAEFIDALKHLLEYTGFPPQLPTQVSSNGNEEKTFSCAAARDKLAILLKYCSNEYNEPAWNETAEIFNESGKEIIKLSNVLTDFLINNKNELNIITDIFLGIAIKEEKAYKIIYEYLKYK
jgi:hypothetical protein